MDSILGSVTDVAAAADSSAGAISAAGDSGGDSTLGSSLLIGVASGCGAVSMTDPHDWLFTNR
ncbi:MAG: hypothetical protein WA743_01320 [Pseudolabrys sp.]